jgi:hypothetical protein
MAVKYDTREYHTALASADPLMALREIVRRELRDNHMPREDLLEALEDLRTELRDGEREDLEDIVLEVMDFVTGWCSPQMRL